MADFVQTMKDWRRMCKTLGADSCEGCKLHADGNDCVAVYEGEMDYAKLEKAVTEWAAENPEPVYPTFYDWIESVMGDDRNLIVDDHDFAAWMNITRIPAVLAQKLGIEPKEK